MSTITIPPDYAVQPCQPHEAKDPVTCCTCGLTWDDDIVTSMTPAPSARCPFEAFHVDVERASMPASAEPETYRRWLDTYTAELRRAVDERPDEYVWSSKGDAEVERVARKMTAGLTTGAANKDGIAIRRTCRRLGVPYTYAGIKKYLTKQGEGPKS